MAGRLPLWLKASYALGTPVVAIVYWNVYGPSNFLWLSDIALGLTTAAVLTENRLLASMAAVGVLLFETAWTVDFVTGGNLIGLAAYMFSAEQPLWLRGLSLFHLALPPTLIWFLYRFGYDRRALPLQTAVTLAALGTSFFATDPDDNINWVFGPGKHPPPVPPLIWFAALLAAVPLLAMLPTHFLLRRLFGRGA